MPLNELKLSDDLYINVITSYSIHYTKLYESEQTESTARVSNVSRSWSPLKSGLRVWFKRTLDLDSDYYYRVLIADINKEQASVFRPRITSYNACYTKLLRVVEHAVRNDALREAVGLGRGIALFHGDQRQDAAADRAHRFRFV